MLLLSPDTGSPSWHATADLQIGNIQITIIDIYIPQRRISIYNMKNPPNLTFVLDIDNTQLFLVLELNYVIS